MLVRLASFPRLAIDTETTSLRPYHGGRLFSIAVAASPTLSWYFNFQAYPGLPPEQILTPRHLQALQPLLEQVGLSWYLHNAKFDEHMLAQEGLFIRGTVHCTKQLARIEYNEHHDYSLEGCAERLGLKKDDTVERYIEEHHLWEWEEIPGRVQRKKNKHYDQVPFDIIAPYAEQDARVTFALGESQRASFERVDAQQKRMPPAHRQMNIVDMERELTQVVFEMERRGVLIDIPYTSRAISYERDREEKALIAFKHSTGREFSASPKLFAEVFADDKALWLYTEKGNPSFDSNALGRFQSPAARAVLQYRDSKSKKDFYTGFLHHADGHGVLHPHFHPDGARTGRFSSSDPNLQNLTDEEGQEAQEFLVRRAIIPPPGHVFLLPDFSQMEYRLMLDYAEEKALIQKVLEGLDVHEGTAQMMGISRKYAKTLNFMLLYGGGVAKLCIALFKPNVSETLLKEICTRFLYQKEVEHPSAIAPEVVEYNLAELTKARDLRDKYFSALPGVQKFIKEVQESVHARGFIRNWAGRRCYFPNLEYDYTAPNTLIQGGCADINKFALVRTAKLLQRYRAKLVLTIHDENPIECPEDEALEVSRHVVNLMEVVYPHKHLPLTVGLEWSGKSLADKVKGFPGEKVA